MTKTTDAPDLVGDYIYVRASRNRERLGITE